MFCGLEDIGNQSMMALSLSIVKQFFEKQSKWLTEIAHTRHDISIEPVSVHLHFLVHSQLADIGNATYEQ